MTTKTARMRDGSAYQGNSMFLGQGIKKSCGKCGKHFASSGMKHHRIYGAICSGCAEAKKGAA